MEFQREENLSEDHYPQLGVNFTLVKLIFVAGKNYPEIGVNITFGFFCMDNQLHNSQLNVTINSLNGVYPNL